VCSVPLCRGGVVGRGEGGWDEGKYERGRDGMGIWDGRYGLMFCIGKPLLVPLTTSLYVPGTLADTPNVIVDVGTGYYVEKVFTLPSLPPPLPPDN